MAFASTTSDGEGSKYSSLPRFEIEDEEEPEEEAPQAPHRCCFGWCCRNMAVVIVMNAIMIVISTGLSLFGAFMVAAFSTDNPNATVAMVYISFFLGFTLIEGYCVLFPVMGIYGVRKFKKNYVGFAGIGHAVKGIMWIMWSFVQPFWIPFVIWYWTLAYLHWKVFEELHGGRITPENYDKQKTCCGSCADAFLGTVE